MDADLSFPAFEELAEEQQRILAAPYVEDPDKARDLVTRHDLQQFTSGLVEALTVNLEALLALRAGDRDACEQAIIAQRDALINFVGNLKAFAGVSEAGGG